MSRATAGVRLAVGTGLLMMVLALAVLSLLWTPYDPAAIDIGARFLPPSSHHWFGTDAFGRDVLSMLMRGARTALAVPVAALVVGAGMGIPLGLASAACRGAVDTVIMRLADVLYAFPSVLVAVLIAASLGPGAINTVIAIGLVSIPVLARVTRNAALGLWSRDYIAAARVAGLSAPVISVRHILPNLVRLLAVQVSIQLSIAVLADAALSYIGLGAQPPEPSWGRMIEEAQTTLAQAPWLSVFPGLAVVATVLGFGLAGEGAGALGRQAAPKD
jgi:peptide/nickel transport system permease protein